MALSILLHSSRESPQYQYQHHPPNIPHIPLLPLSKELIAISSLYLDGTVSVPGYSLHRILRRSQAPTVSQHLRWSPMLCADHEQDLKKLLKEVPPTPHVDRFEVLALTGCKVLTVEIWGWLAKPFVCNQTPTLGVFQHALC